jgi:hypothetical protein
VLLDAVVVPRCHQRDQLLYVLDGGPGEILRLHEPTGPASGVRTVVLEEPVGSAVVQHQHHRVQLGDRGLAVVPAKLQQLAVDGRQLTGQQLLDLGLRHAVYL